VSCARRKELPAEQSSSPTSLFTSARRRSFENRRCAASKWDWERLGNGPARVDGERIGSAACSYSNPAKSGGMRSAVFVRLPVGMGTVRRPERSLGSDLRRAQLRCGHSGPRTFVA
jgi:hypothetical protein